MGMGFEQGDTLCERNEKRRDAQLGKRDTQLIWDRKRGIHYLNRIEQAKGTEKVKNRKSEGDS